MGKEKELFIQQGHRKVGKLFFYRKEVRPGPSKEVERHPQYPKMNSNPTQGPFVSLMKTQTRICVWLSFGLSLLGESMAQSFSPPPREAMYWRRKKKEEEKRRTTSSARSNAELPTKVSDEGVGTGKERATFRVNFRRRFYGFRLKLTMKRVAPLTSPSPPSPNRRGFQEKKRNEMKRNETKGGWLSSRISSSSEALEENSLLIIFSHDRKRSELAKAEWSVGCHVVQCRNFRISLI